MSIANTDYLMYNVIELGSVPKRKTYFVYMEDVRQADNVKIFEYRQDARQKSNIKIIE